MSKQYTFLLTEPASQFVTARKSSYSQTFTSYTLNAANVGRISFYSSYYYCTAFMWNRANNAADLDHIRSLPAGSILSATVTLNVNATSSNANTYYYGATKSTDGSDVSIPARQGPVKRESVDATTITFDIKDTIGIVDALTFGQSSSSPAYDTNVSSAVLTVVTNEIVYDYTLTYNANGGTGAPASQTKSIASTSSSRPSVEWAVSNTQPTRIGHTFNGWATSSTAVTGPIPAGGTYTSAAANPVLYAVWKANGFDVKYFLNGAEGTAPAAQTKLYGIDLVLRDDEPVRSGYTFEGWATSPDGSAVYQPGDTYSVNAALNLYAVWAMKTYTVRYMANGGNNAPVAQIKGYNETVLISAQQPTFADHTFVEWNTDAAGNGDTYSAGQAYSANADLILYAIWSEDEKSVTVSLNPNGGTVDIRSITVKTGEVYGELPEPEYDHHIFDGWYTQAAGGSRVYDSTVCDRTDDHTLFAHWSAIPSTGFKRGIVYIKRGGRMMPTEIIV